MPKKIRPTIAELEHLIQRDEEDTITILPDGTIEASEPSAARRLEKIMRSPERQNSEY